MLKDAIGRDWQCGTTQVDFNLPGRLGAFYIDEHSEKKTPVMIHRAMFGSLERFTGILIENFAGHFPLWLAPLQVVVAPIVSDADAYAHGGRGRAEGRAGLRVETDLRNEKINYKVREHSLAKVPVMLVVGKREAEERKVSIRRLGSDKQTVIALDEAIAALVAEAKPPGLAFDVPCAGAPCPRASHSHGRGRGDGPASHVQRLLSRIVASRPSTKPRPGMTSGVADECDGLSPYCRVLEHLHRSCAGASSSRKLYWDITQGPDRPGQRNSSELCPRSCGRMSAAL